jgi:hypothetical protein
MSTLKQMIKAYMDRNTNHTSWDRHLLEFQLAYNSSLHPGINFTPFSLVHGREPRLLDQVDFGVTNISHDDYTDMTKSFLALAIQTVRLENQKVNIQNAERINQQRIEPSFQAGDTVLLRTFQRSSSKQLRVAKLLKPYSHQQFHITQILGADRYNLENLITGDRVQNVQANRLRLVSR